VTVTVFDSTGRAFGGKKTNVVAGSLNPYWFDELLYTSSFLPMALWADCEDVQDGKVRVPRHAVG
jgi:hypothetical protein